MVDQLLWRPPMLCREGASGARALIFFWHLRTWQLWARHAPNASKAPRGTSGILLWTASSHACARDLQRLCVGTDGQRDYTWLYVKALEWNFNTESATQLVCSSPLQQITC